VVLGFLLFAVIRKTLRLNMESGSPVYRPMQLADMIALLMVAVAVLAVALRRRRPFFMLGVLLAGSVVVSALSGPSPAALFYFLPVAYVLYLIAANFERKQAAIRVLSAVVVTLVIDDLLLAAAGGGDTYHNGTLIPVLLFVVLLFVVIAWSTGYIVRQRRRYSIGLQEEAASKAVAEERLRIARELHDVVAHSMSVIAVQAGYGQYVIDSQPADARAALGAIQATSREALDEMRRMLGALRQADADGDVTHADGGQSAHGAHSAHGAQGEGAHGAGGASSGVSARYLAAAPEGDGSRPTEGMGALVSLFRQAGSFPAAPSPVGTAAAPLFPAPGLDDLDRLVKRTASAGVQVEVQRRGALRPLPASIDLSAYRVIQEALTNVVKHAHASRCDVTIDYADELLMIRVTDSGAGLPAAPSLVGAASVRSALADPLPGGHGIIGMRERVSLLGGEFSAGPLPGYGFEVVARIPLPAGAGS